MEPTVDAALTALVYEGWVLRCARHEWICDELMTIAEFEDTATGRVVSATADSLIAAIDECITQVTGRITITFA